MINNGYDDTGRSIDTLQGVAGAVTTGNFQESDVWFYIAMVEFVIIFFLLLFAFRRGTTRVEKQKLRESIKSDVDFQNIINSSFHATEIYNELKVKCHPDRFIGDVEKNATANRIFQEVTKNKMNYKRLQELKKEAEESLGINF